jgi:hypothetical protein
VYSQSLKKLAKLTPVGANVPCSLFHLSVIAHLLFSFASEHIPQVLSAEVLYDFNMYPILAMTSLSLS